MSRSSTSTNQKVNAAELTRLLHAGKVIVRYILSRFDRQTNTQNFYAEVIALHWGKAEEKYIVQRLVFSNEVADFFIKIKNIPDLESVELLDRAVAEKRIEEIVTAWKDRPRGWRKEVQFAGVLSIHEERIDLPPTSSHFMLYHGHIEATLWGLVCIAYREEGAAGNLTKYHALLDTHAKFAAFAGKSCIGRALLAFNEG